MNIRTELEQDEFKYTVQRLRIYDNTTNELLSVFTPLDIAYTLAQGYSEVLTAPNVYLSRQFPESCHNFTLDENETALFDVIENTGVGMFFDADGIFVFKNELSANPDRAVSEFLDYYRKGDVILGPDYSIAEVEADAVKVQHNLGKGKSIYIYYDSPV